jgi:ubiquitin conjugation factor E4 B
MALANATVDMFGYLTLNPEIVKPFMASEIVSRLAAMLDYNMVALAGPKCSDLKVENPEKYHFDPKKLLGGLTTVFVNLSNRQEFILACARDGRSFDKKVFERAAGILSKHLIKTPDDIQKLMSFVKTVEILILKELKDEEELGEVPDEFLDPLLFTLMEEPVKLPSGISVDLSTIRSHLLSDQHDPFNRQPLTIEQVVPDIDLKAKILEWKQANSKK